MPNRSGSNAANAAAPVEERELRAAHEIARAFLAASHPHEVYRLALTRLTPVVQADFAAVFLRDDDDPDALRPVVVHGWPQSSAIYLGQLRIRVGRGLTGMAVAADSAIEVENVFADARLAEWWQPARELGFTAMIALPLRAEYGAIGAVSFYFAGARVFNAEERRLLQLIAEQLAATAARINVVDSLRLENHRLQRENKALLGQLDALRATARESNELVVEAGHDLSRALRPLRAASQSDPGGDALLAAAAMDRIITDIVTLCSLRLGRIRPESAPEDATRLGRVALEDARPFLSLPVTMSDDVLVVPLSTDGTCVVRILSALTTYALQTTVRGGAALEVERVGGNVVWTLRVNGFGLEHDGAMEKAGAPPARSSLDLALARERAASLGGSIMIGSEPGHARTYALRLPSRAPVRG